MSRKIDWPVICLVTFMFMFVVLWWPHRLEVPRYWYDEAVNYQIARNGAEAGVLNLVITPDEGYPLPYQFQTSGYPLSAPLAILFKLFGASFELARGYMLVWFFALLTSVFFFVRRLSGPWLALASALIVGTFAPIIFHSLSIIGEAPALTFMIWSAYFFSRYQSDRGHMYLGAHALALGLMLASKPLFAPVALMALLVHLSNRDNMSKREWGVLATYFALPIVIFAVLVLPNGFTFSDVLNTYQNRATHGNLVQNIFTNLSRLPNELSLIYTLMLGSLLALHSRFIIRSKSTDQSGQLTHQSFGQTHKLLISYCLGMTAFFLISAGWNRYLLATQIILLLSLPVALAGLIRKKWLVALVIILTLTLHVYQFNKVIGQSFWQNAWYARLTEFVNTEAPEGKVFVLWSAETASVVPLDRLYFHTRFEDREVMPNKLLELDKYKFDYIITKPNNIDFIPYRSLVEKNYVVSAKIENLEVWRRK